MGWAPQGRDRRGRRRPGPGCGGAAWGLEAVAARSSLAPSPLPRRGAAHEKLRGPRKQEGGAFWSRGVRSPERSNVFPEAHRGEADSCGREILCDPSCHSPLVDAPKIILSRWSANWKEGVRGWPLSFRRPGPCARPRCWFSPACGGTTTSGPGGWLLCPPVSAGPARPLRPARAAKL